MSDNLPEVTAALKAWQRRIDASVALATRQITIALWEDARKIAHETVNPPTQTQNTLRHNPHIGPRNGEGPNYATGSLYRGIIAAPVRRSGFGSYTASVGSTVDYARTVEEGSARWGSGVKYPYMMPARDRLVQSGKASQYIRDAVRVAMGG